MVSGAILSEAIRQANKSEFARARLGAVLFKRGKMLGSGFNSTNRHQSLLRTTHWEGSCHAEVAAIVSGLKRHSSSLLRNSSLCVVRIGKTGKLLMAKPCQDCYDVIANVGIKDVYFSDENESLSVLKVRS